MPAENNKAQQRFHGNRANSMKIGMRGILFTVNPQHESKAYRELASLMDKTLAEYPEKYFPSPVIYNNNNNNQQEENDEQAANDETEDEQKQNNENTEDNVDTADIVDNNDNNNGGSGGTFADELKAELEGLPGNKNNNSNNEDGNQQQQNTSNTSQKKNRPPKAPRRYRMIDTNCKGYVFAAINFDEEFENGDRLAEQQRQQQQQAGKEAPVFNFCAGEAATLILDISQKLVDKIANSDVPLLRFTYYLYPCLSTAAPTVHAAGVLAEATKLHVPIPQGKSAAKIETHFTVRNNSGVSNNLVLDEIKKSFQEKLPMGKYFVTNQSGGKFRRQRQQDSQQQQPQRILNASVSFIVLHSAALLCIQPDFTEKKEYALHKMGASFAESLN